MNFVIGDLVELLEDDAIDTNGVEWVLPRGTLGIVVGTERSGPRLELLDIDLPHNRPILFHPGLIRLKE